MALSDIFNPLNLGNSATKAIVSGSVPQDLFRGLNTVIGRPYAYLENTDPRLRTFTRHMLPSAPLVMIRPGRVKFSENVENYIAETLSNFKRDLSGGTDAVRDLLRGTTTADGKSVGGGLFSNNYGVADSDLAAIEQAIKDKQAGTVADLMAGDNMKSIRYFEFNSSNEVMKEYQSVLQTLSSRLYSRMNAKALAWADVRGNWDPPAMNNGGFWTYWADNATSVSESADSDVGASKMSGLVKGVSEISREAQFFLGKDVRTTQTTDGMLESALQGVAGFIGGDARDASLRASLGDAILGLNPMFPEIWKDSSFSRSYTLNFKFHTPYGNPAAVYQDVLLPFTMLLSIVMPVMVNPGTYSEPFIFQLDCPGYFACDLGICTSFSFTRGGSDNLWTVDGLPRQIDVNMTVKDLYPVLTASKNNESMYFNIGMGTFLDNLAGISLFKSEYGKADLVTRMKAGANSTFRSLRGAPNRWSARSQEFIQQYTPLPAIFRAVNS